MVSVTSQAQVKQWYEENDEEIQNALYWRQAFDVRTYELSVRNPPLSVIRIPPNPCHADGRDGVQLRYPGEPRQDASWVHNG